MRCLTRPAGPALHAGDGEGKGRVGDPKHGGLFGALRAAWYPRAGDGHGPAAVLDGPAPAKRRRLALLTTLVLFGTGASIVFHYVMAYYLGRGYPYSTFLFLPAAHFSDWTDTFRYAQHFLSGQQAPFVYFPFAFVLVAAATVAPAWVGLALLCLAYLAALARLLWREVLNVLPGTHLKLQYGFVLIVMAYPVLFTLDRGNLEMLEFLTVGGMFYFVYRRPSSWGAGLCLAAAIAMKLYPATLVVLLLAERRFKAALVAAVGAVVFTVAATGALAALSGQNVAQVWHLAYAEKGVYQNTMVDAAAGIQHSHTLWGLLRMPALLAGLNGRPWQPTAYALVAVATFGLLAVHVIFREQESWRKAALMVIAAILLPYVSADYTTPLIFFPLVMFLNSARVSRYDIIYTCLFGALLVPMDYRYFAELSSGDISISVVAYAVVLLALLILIVSDGGGRERAVSLPESRRGVAPEGAL
jgi:hypothetical protein